MSGAAFHLCNTSMPDYRWNGASGFLNLNVFCFSI
jgi:hypothetical protein